MRLTLPASVLAAMAALALGCGSGDEEQDAGRIEVSGSSASDRQIAIDLRAYVERGCSQTSTREEFRAGIARAEEPPPPLLRKYVVRRYGSIDRAFESLRQVCDGYRKLDIEQGVITVETALENDRAGRIGAEDVCNVIQGSDVADFTRGRAVLGADGRVLMTCSARPG